MRSPKNAIEDGHVAIIGMGCRFPGARSARELWELLIEGRDAVGVYPGNRFPRVDAFLAEAADSAENAAMAAGGFLDKLDQFDAVAFELSPREAMYLDPQHRLLLEVAWAALEDAGQPLQDPRTTNTAVFAGLWSSDFENVLYGSGAELDFYAMTGSGSYGASGRLSFTFGFEGPSVSVDAACSSSLVTVHLACQSLLARECDMALAGGANAILATDSTRMFTEAGMLARDGRCKFGSAEADGFVRSEGAGMVVLKRLKDAVAAGDPIHAVIRGGAVSNDGRTSGTLMTPSRTGQRQTLGRAWATAGVSGRDIRYFEAHGTGTSVGDPVEVGAIMDALRDDGAGVDARCWIGSIKSNIGHTESAAGIAGLIKTALALKYRVIPKSRLTGALNPKIDWDASPLRLLTDTLNLCGEEKPVIAAVSSFALTGTNAHLVLQEYRKEEPAAEGRAAAAYLVPVSARSEEALDELLRSYETYSVEGGGIHDVAYTASLRRRHDESRAAIVCGDIAELNESAVALRNEHSVAGRRAVSVREGKRRVVFIAPGQGSQWAGMARELFVEEPVFREMLERCDAAIRVETGWSLIEVLLGPGAEAALKEIDVVQPALFSLSVSLAELWKSRGIVPDAVVGHSMGEVAAAFIAGALSLPDAAAVICRRSRLMRTIRGAGAMLTVELPVSAIEALLQEVGGAISVAASNSPESTIVSGNSAAIARLEELLMEREVFCRRVKVDVASHSAQVDPILDELRESLKGIEPKRCEVPLFSSVTGGFLTGTEMDAQYWAANLREPVGYANGIATLARDGYDVFVELSPHPVLMPGTEATLKSAGRGALAVASTRRERPERREMLASLGELYRFGCDVTWESFYPVPARCVALPEYPFQRERCWPELEELKVGAYARRTGADGGNAAHPLLRSRFESATQPGVVTWEIVADTAVLPYLLDHKVHGAAVFPAAAQLELVLEALRAERAEGEFAIAAMRFESAMQIEEQGAREFQLGLRRNGDAYAVEIFGRPAGSGGEWTRHSSGIAELRRPVAERAPVDLLRMKRTAMLDMEKRQHYRIRTRAGIEYGPAFQLVEEAWCGAGESLLRIGKASDGRVKTAGYAVHPALLDNCFQALQLAQPNGEGFLFDDTSLPVAIERMEMFAPIPHSGDLFCHAKVTSADAGEGTLRGDLTVVDSEGRVLVVVTGFTVQRVSAAMEERASELLLEVAWEPYQLPSAGQTGRGGLVLVFSDGNGAGEMLAGRVEASGGLVALVRQERQFDVVERGSNRRDYAIDATRSEDLRSVFADLAARGEQPVAVVHLWSIDRSGGDVAEAFMTGQAFMSGQDFMSGQTAGAYFIPWLVQEIAACNWAMPPRLWIVTSESVAAGGGESKPALSGAATWGIGAVAAVEHPELRTSLVDLSKDVRAEEVDGLVRLLSSGVDEDRIAIRGPRMFVERFVAAKIRDEKIEQSAAGAMPKEKTLFRKDATYLIAGGMGGVGATVAEWMSANGAGCLVLISRRAESDETRKIVGHIERLGARVIHARTDICDRAELETLLEKLRSEMRPIAGIMQAATVIGDALLTELFPARFDTVMGPKVAGTWNLYDATATDKLDFIVLFSSIASVYPQPGHGSYAAANAFMDAFARWARADGRKVTSINWGGWEGIGLARETGTGRSISGYGQQGFGTMTGARALTALKLAMEVDVVQAVASPFDGEQAAEFFAGGNVPPVLRRLLSTAQGPNMETRETTVQARLRESGSLAEAVEILQEYLVEELSRTLKLASSRIGRETLFGSIGLDSLMTLELVRRLKTGLGVAVPTTAVFNHPTATLLAAEVARRMQLHPEAKDAFEDRRPAEHGLSSDIRTTLMADDLSEEEAVQALMQPVGN